MTLDKADFVFVGLAIGSGLLCYATGASGVFGEALRQAATLLLIVLPLLAGGLLIAGLTKQLVVKDKIASLLGDGSGLRGLVIATVAGVLTPGGPLMVFPLVCALWTAGAEAGVLIAYITAWSLLGMIKLIAWELPLMGIEFTSVRFVVCLPLPILAGLLARRLSEVEQLRPTQKASK